MQLNNGNNTFSEIGYFAGITNTDWSWSALMIDFDNDSYKDLFITNGYQKDYRDNDFMIKVRKMQEEAILQNKPIKTSAEVAKMIPPAAKLLNYYYNNNGDLTFTNKTEESGIEIPSFSNGAAYADLDNDGDLDLVVNNVQDYAFVYRNNAREINSNNYVGFKLKGDSSNPMGIGTKIMIRTGPDKQIIETTISRGFLSSMTPVAHFGLGNIARIEELKVIWPDGLTQTINDVDVNQVLTLDHAQATSAVSRNSINKALFVDVTSSCGLDFIHKENDFDDFKKQVLLPHKMSQFGPDISVGDLNDDGLDDIYIGGAHQQSGAIFIQNVDATFERLSNPVIEKDRIYEDVGSAFIDFDDDGDLDLYVVSGGNEFEAGSMLLVDRLYENDGRGNFTKTMGAIPLMQTSGSCAVVADYDGDGDDDLFIGGRLVPGKYPFPAQSYILRNEGGRFVDVTAEVAPELMEIGMVTSATWTDYDSDQKLDLIIVGEWMPITVFRNTGNGFENKTEVMSLSQYTGWWNIIISDDFDNDGDPDFIAGNLGLNYKYKATIQEPLHVYCYDFDNTGTLDIVLGYYNDGSCYPVRGRQCSSEQMPNIKQKFPSYAAFGNATLQDVYGENLETALHHEAKYFASAYIKNNGSDGFELIPLPKECQLSTVFGIIPFDYNNDGNKDIILAGNFYVSEVETGRADAGIGLLLEGDGHGGFDPIPITTSGFRADRDVRDLEMLKTSSGQVMIIIGNNNYRTQIYKKTGDVPPLVSIN